MLYCKKCVALNVYQKVRHDANLIFRNVVRRVSKEDIETPTIGRRVFESTGRNNREMLEAGGDKLGGEIDVAEMVQKAITRRKNVIILLQPSESLSFTTVVSMNKASLRKRNRFVNLEMIFRRRCIKISR